jgi:hypothetical protein
VSAVPDAELGALSTVAVHDVLHGIYTYLHQKVADDVFLLPIVKLRTLTDVELDRQRRPLKKTKRAALRQQGQVVVDYLAEGVMFDGFVLVKIDDRGGLELEPVLRKSTLQELQRLDPHQE